jgi:hypothetical protein
MTVSFAASWWLKRGFLLHESYALTQSKNVKKTEVVDNQWFEKMLFFCVFRTIIFSISKNSTFLKEKIRNYLDEMKLLV